MNLYTNAVAFYAGIRLIKSGQLSFQPMFTVLMAIMITATGMGRASTFTSTFEKAKHSAISTFELIDRQPLIDPDQEGAEPEVVQGDVEFKDIRFAYPARPNVEIFKGNFGFKGKAHQTIALVVSTFVLICEKRRRGKRSEECHKKKPPRIRISKQKNADLSLFVCEPQQLLTVFVPRSRVLLVVASRPPSEYYNGGMILKGELPRSMTRTLRSIPLIIFAAIWHLSVKSLFYSTCRSVTISDSEWSQTT